MTAIPRRSSQDSIDEIASALDEAGCVVVTDVLGPDVRKRVTAELSPFLDAAPVSTVDDPSSFYPGHTRRVTALVARSQAVREIIVHPTMTALCDHHLSPECDRYQLHVTAALCVGPGSRSQILHREEDPFTTFPLPRPNLVLASMSALTEFTAENGGTLLVPGSHRWDDDRKAHPAEIVSAEMPAGAILYWLGGTLHGAGANTTNDWRYGVILTYSLGWLRQEENQFLDVPPDVARSLSPELLALTGRSMCGSLGFFDPAVQVEN